MPTTAKEEDDAFELRRKSVETPAGAVEIAYVTCRPLAEAGFTNAFSTRVGGVSPFPVAALSLSQSKLDTAADVAENRRRFLEALGAGKTAIATAHQTHSTDRWLIEARRDVGHEPDADALITRMTGILLGVKTADCLPILIADPKSGAMAAVHAGWKGTAGRIAERTVADLVQRAGASARDAIAALGPVACGECYEIGQDVIDKYKKEFGYWKRLIRTGPENKKATLDIRAANVQQLLFCGFTEDRIHVAPYCTMERNDLFFSYRREGAGGARPVGRLLSVIGRMGLGSAGS